MIKSYNSLRFFGMIAVFFSHSLVFMCEEQIAYPLFQNYLNNAAIGVSFFVILSGFLTALKYHDKLSHPTSGTYWVFIKKRVLSFYLIYVISILINVPFMWEYIKQYPLKNLLKLILNLGLVQSLSPSAQIAWSYNSDAWTLSALFLIWLVAPWLLQAARMLYDRWHEFGLLVTMIVVYFGYSSLVFLKINDDWQLYLFYYSPFYRGIEFFVGVCTYMLIAGKSPNARIVNSYTELAVVVLCLAAFVPKGICIYSRTGFDNHSILLPKGHHIFLAGK